MQTSLFSFTGVSEQKKAKLGEKAAEKRSQKKIQERPREKVEPKTPEKRLEKKPEPKGVETKPKKIPKELFFKGNDAPFGLKEGNIKLEHVKRESASSKYVRFLLKKGEIVQDLKRGLLLDVDYDGGQNKAYCKFYDLDAEDIKIWIDTTGHEPYCLSKDSKVKLENNIELTNYNGFVRIDEIKRFDLLRDKEVTLTKIYGKTPIDIGGSGTNIKNILEGKVWEADLRYHLNYIYDRGLIPGLNYSIKDGKIKKIDFEEDKEESEKIINELKGLFKQEKKEIQEFSEQNLNLFLTPITDVKRMALDIEIQMGPNDYKIPDPNTANQEVISISFVATDGLKLVYVLERENFNYGEPYEKFPIDAKIIFFKTEKSLLIETFRLMWEYPVVITFNGDNFDLNYLFHRANKLKIDRDLNPIQVKRGFGFMAKAECDLRKGIHIDIFNFFFNRSISGYAFGGAYERNSLDAISSALLGEGKYQHEEEIHDMEYNILAWYNLKDSLLTLELTKFNNSLTWNLIILLCRITKMPIHDMIRHQISAWIKNIFYFEHRQQNFLIPHRSEISELKKGGFSSSIIEGKGFKGAYVIPPVPGIHFDVVVMDFSSLYPSIIKEYNLSYETVLCPHDDCKDNLTKGIPYHVCTHKMGIFSYIVGFLRDIRVKYFKPKSGDKNLSSEKRSYYTTIQQALKVFINASYGVFGSKNFPLFCLPVAESITGIGQYSIKATIKKSEELGVKILYGDSIIGSRCIVIKKENFINVMPIEEFWDSIKQPIKIVNGKEIKTPISIYTLSSNGEWQKIKQIIRHKTDKKIYRVNQKNGETICTEDHSLITEEFEAVKPEDLGDRKIRFLEVVPHEISINEEIVDLFPIVNHFSYETPYKGRKKLNSWKADDKYIWFGRTNRKDQKKIKRFCHMNDLCKILGIYIADGHSSFYEGKFGYKAACGISNNDIEFLNEIKNIMERIDFNHKISMICTSKGVRTVQGYTYEDKTHRIQTNSTTWTAFFKSLCGAGSENKHLPSFIFNVEKEYQELLYKYYLIGDGSIEQGKNTFTTKSLHLVSGLCYLLKSWKIDTSIYYYEKRDVYRIREREKSMDIKHPIKTKLIILPYKERYVYDLSVENTEMFVDACGMILLHNTDSIFLLNPSKGQMNEISKWCKEELDLDLEEEKTYQFLALSKRKKNYIGIYKDTKHIDMKGLVAKKRNTPEFIKKIFSELIEILKEISNNDDFLKAKNKIILILRDNLKKIGKPNTFTLEDYAINIGLQKKLKDYVKVVPQHVKAAIELRKATGKEYQKGEIITFIKSKGVVGAKAIELAKLQDIDTKKYRELLQSALEQVLDALGISFEEIKGIRKMDAFF